jgi:hypothetical protein
VNERSGNKLEGNSPGVQQLPQLTETVNFYPLSIMPEPPDVFVGRIDIDSYAAFPEDGVELLKQLQAGASPQQAAAWYEQRYGEAIDIADFLETLSDLHLIREGPAEAHSDSISVQLVSWQWVGQALFSPFAWIIYFVLWCACAYLLLHFPALRPSYQHLFFTPSYTLMELGLIVGQLPTALLHESYHLLAGRRLGLPTRLSMSRRFYFLVFESHLYGLWSVPRRQRYLPFLAGMLFDLLCFTCLTIIASVATPASLLGAYCLALAFTIILRLLWQCYFYLQTDIYYVLTTALGCINLQQATRYYLTSRLRGWFGRGNPGPDEEQWHPRDLQVARWYVYLLVLGYLFSAGALFYVGLPVTWRVVVGVVSHLFAGTALGANFWDACLFLVVNGIQLALVLVIFLRERRRRQARARS